MRSILLILLAAPAFGLTVHAAQLEGLPVTAIRFEPPQQPLSEATLADLVTLQVGQPLTSEAVADSIRELFQTGRYANLSVDARAQDDGVLVTFLTESNWFMGNVEIRGVDSPPTAPQLETATRLRLGRLLTPESVSEAQRQLRALLRENGFQTPAIRVERVENEETRSVDLIFWVTAGERSHFGEILITGDTRLDAAQTREVARWKPKKLITDERIEDGVARLRQSLQKDGYWQSEVDVIGRDFNPDDQRVDLILKVEQGPRVVVRVEGFKLGEKTVRRYVPIFEEGVVDEDLIVEGARNLRNYLQSKGYFDAAVEHERANSGEQVEIVYRIEPGARRSLDKVELSGVQFFPEDTIRERLLVEEKSLLQRRRGRFSEALLERDVESIERLYRTNGFRDVQVQSRLDQNFQGEQGTLAVLFDISEGRPTLVESLEVSGMERFPLTAEEYRFSTEANQPFSESSVAADRDLVLAEYYDAGFQDASFDWFVEPAGESGRVAVAYQVREGKQLRVRSTVVDGRQHTRAELIERQILLEPGAPLSQTAMFESQRRLYDLGIFSKVEVALQNPDGDEPAKDVLFELQESRRWAIGFGGGAEFARLGGAAVNVNSPIGEAAFSPRATVEITRLNLRGKGHTFGLRTRVSNLQQRALATYENPRFAGSEKWKMIVSGLYDTSRNVRTFTGARAEGAFQLEHKLSSFRTGLYRYTYRRTTIDEETLRITPLLIPLNSQPVRAALFSGTYIEDRRDDPIDATRGSFNTVDLGFASGYWGSQPDFIRFLGQNSTYHRIGRKLTLARTVQVGLLTPWGDKELLDDPSAGLFLESRPDPRLPLSERFFSGGANSHRGFPFNQAGPRDPTTGFPIGGGAQILHSLELRFPLLGDNIGGVLFHDAGNVYSTLGDVSLNTQQERVTQPDGRELFDYDYMVHAVGFGLRYRTPIGPVRIDMAYGLNAPRFVGFSGSQQDFLAGTGEVRTQRVNAFQFHFSLGQTF